MSIITSSPIDIEERSPEVHNLVRGRHETKVFQKRREYENAPTRRTKDELISYLKDLEAVIKTDDYRFALLPALHSKNQFDQMLVEVHNQVVNKVNYITTAARKKQYINAYINKINQDSFLARGKRTTKRKRMKRKGTYYK